MERIPALNSHNQYFRTLAGLTTLYGETLFLATHLPDSFPQNHALSHFFRSNFPLADESSSFLAGQAIMFPFALAERNVNSPRWVKKTIHTIGLLTVAAVNIALESETLTNPETVKEVLVSLLGAELVRQNILNFPQILNRRTSPTSLNTPSS